MERRGQSCTLEDSADDALRRSSQRQLETHG
jgi:hypothetical protein